MSTYFILYVYFDKYYVETFSQIITYKYRIYRTDIKQIIYSIVPIYYLFYYYINFDIFMSFFPIDFDQFISLGK